MAYDCSFLTDHLADGQVSFGDDDRDGHAGDWGTPTTSVCDPMRSVGPNPQRK